MLLPSVSGGQEAASGAPVASYSDDALDNQGMIDPANLEKFPLQDMNLSAIVVKSDPAYNIALLEVGGVGYNVQKGSKVGSGNGVVREITETNVIIDELGPDGKPSGKTVTLSFKN
jgi:Tfp pilus assembly protein PilP